MGKLEAEVQALVQMEAMKFNCRLMRNNSGALRDATGRSVRYGLGNVSKIHQDKIASSDLIGFTKVTITPDMVGQTVAVFTAIECKQEDWKGPKDKREAAQSAFICWIVSNGGIAGFVKSIDMLRAVLGK